MKELQARLPQLLRMTLEATRCLGPSLAADDVAALSSTGFLVLPRPGQRLVTSGHLARHVLLVLRGRVQLAVLGDDGATAEVVGENELGELVGEFGLLMARHDRKVGCARACDVLGASPDCAVRCLWCCVDPPLQCHLLHPRVKLGLRPPCPTGSLPKCW